MKTLEVSLGDRSYPIVIGAGLCRRADLYAPHLAPGRVLLATNETVEPLYADDVAAALSDALAGRTDGDAAPVSRVVLPDGERHKTLDSLTPVFDALVDNGCGRDATVVALGGGVLGDIAGFAAACYQRGIRFIQVPTTLLAQVDSSVGGKTGVNHPAGKNFIGAFHQPAAVIIDVATLDTLDDRELKAGLAEVIKYGLILDAAFFDWLEGNMDALLARDTDALIHAIECSCRAKALIVARDEHEQGQRALLNLGHTFGHAIENLAGYGEWLHGEAVAAGMIMAADMSCRLGWLDEATVTRIEALIDAAGLPTRPPALAPEAMLTAMARDKKVSRGRIRLVLMKALGQAAVVSDYPDELLTETLAHFAQA